VCSSDLFFSFCHGRPFAQERTSGDRSHQRAWHDGLPAIVRIDQVNGILSVTKD
jgi:hypothetical protein